MSNVTIEVLRCFEGNVWDTEMVSMPREVFDECEGIDEHGNPDDIDEPALLAWIASNTGALDNPGLVHSAVYWINDEPEEEDG